MPRIGVVTCALSILATFAWAPAAESRSWISPDSIQVLGWDAATQRIYYVVNTPFGSGYGRGTLRYLRYYETRDSSDQQPHHDVVAFFEEPSVEASKDSVRRLISREDAPRRQRFERRLAELGERLVPMPAIDTMPPTAAVRTNPHTVLHDDYADTQYDYLVAFRGLTGRWSSYEACNEPMRLHVRRIHLAPGGRDALAILQRVATDCKNCTDCEFCVALLISARRVAPLKFEWSQVP